MSPGPTLGEGDSAYALGSGGSEGARKVWDSVRPGRFYLPKTCCIVGSQGVRVLFDRRRERGWLPVFAASWDALGRLNMLGQLLRPLHFPAV